jgi:hypothetical protein
MIKNKFAIGKNQQALQQSVAKITGLKNDIVMT